MVTVVVCFMAEYITTVRNIHCSLLLSHGGWLEKGWWIEGDELKKQGIRGRISVGEYVWVMID